MENKLGTPWTFSENGPITDAEGEPIFRPGLTEEEYAARARVIATAPKLLASLESLIGMIPLGGVGSSQWRAAVEQARINIKEAKGGLWE